MAIGVDQLELERREPSRCMVETGNIEVESGEKLHIYIYRERESQ